MTQIVLIPQHILSLTRYDQARLTTIAKDYKTPLTTHSESLFIIMLGHVTVHHFYLRKLRIVSSVKLPTHL